MAITRLFYATDVHGSDVCFRKFVNAGKFYEANILILGGDLTGKMVVPIVAQPDGTYNAEHLGEKIVVKKEDELLALEKKIRDTGFYPYRTNPEEIEMFRADPKKVDALFKRLMTETLERWLRLAEERLTGTGIRCYITGGNDDRFDVVEPVLERSGYAINPESKIVEITKHNEMVSSGYANMTPWRCPRDIPEEELAEKIEAMASQVKNMENCIFNLHVPPYGTGIDEAPQLDENLRPVVVGGAPKMMPVGSTAVSDAIQKYQPLIGLHGHIHESKGTIKIGRTQCFNPGSEYGQGLLRGVILNLDERGRFKSFLFTSG